MVPALRDGSRSYIDLTDTTDIYRNFLLAALETSSSACNLLSVSASRITSDVLPPNSLPTQSVTLTLAVKALAAFFLGAVAVGLASQI